jgi:hypothetical protein
MPAQVSPLTTADATTEGWNLRRGLGARLGVYRPLPAHQRPNTGPLRLVVDLDTGRLTANGPLKYRWTMSH